MKRAGLSVLYLAVGLLASWQFAVLVSKLAQRFSWPLISTRWHGCWDIEHCIVPWWTYAIMAMFIVGPGVGWAIVGFWLGRRITLCRLAASATILTLATAFFYVVFFVAVWS